MTTLLTHPQPGVSRKHEQASRRAHDPLDFVLPPELEADRPSEARGIARDQVRLLVSARGGADIAHTTFRDVGEFLRPGDLLLINTSATLPAALGATLDDGTPLELHVSTLFPNSTWSVELRLPTPEGTVPFLDARAGTVVRMPGGAYLALVSPHRQAADAPRVRIWDATPRLGEPALDYLARHGYPIRYGYVREPWPLTCYQTVFANEPGSAEMPSAGRAFTPELITSLVAQGVQFAPLLLHTGVSSLDEHEPPYEEYYRVSETTARIVNQTRAAGGRVIAIGTTAVRAVETVIDAAGVARAGEGWTDVIITPAHGVRAVDALLTGLHEPRASHLAMLEAIAGRPHLVRAYTEALRQQYLWHEFGDLHLILP